MKNLTLSIVFIGLIFCFTCADTIETDRPDFTETSTLVPTGSLQLESGYTFSAIEESQEHAFGEILLRFDTKIPHLEGRIGLPSFHKTQDSNNSASSFDEISFGVKYAWIEPQNNLSFCTISSISFPFDRNPEPEIKGCLGIDFNDDLRLSTNLNLTAISEQTFYYLQSALSFSLGKTWTEHWGTYIEWYGTLPETHLGHIQHIFNGGVTYLINPDTQLDLRLGTGFSNRNPDYFIGIGFSNRMKMF